ncbi:High affinity cAMP-specific 3',5'-cyclic phosphodiesterase 7A [Coelomomyces lativittatus]|nr:High affinity cAMP-specific 3',5'-cyclic phosphodiesterase 7A [Coelomomyces lativittatus]
MHRLQKVNQELQDKLDNLDKEQFLQEQISNLDVDSPITKVIQMIREIQKKMIHAEVIESLEYAIRLLSSNKLFQIDLNSFKQDIDNDLKAWLNNLLHQNEPEAEAGIELPSLKEEGSMQLLTHKHRFDEEEEYSALSWEIPQFDTNTKLMDVLGKSQSWDFNCFDLAEATNGQPLCHLVIHLLTYYDLFNKLKLDRQKVDRCLKKIDQGYRLNPYHNSIHASDVTQTFHFFLSTMHLADHFSHEEIFACIMAAAIHDLDHPGVNNVYLIETRHSLCLRYNDQSVLENHHCTKGFEWLLVNPETNFLSDLPLTSLRHIRQCMIKMVLATDMVGHFEHVSKFKNKVQSQGILFKEVMEIGLKCADISNPTKMPALSQKWAELVLAEFFLQGDLEREHGMNISRFMDRNIPSVSKCQLGFMDFIVTPMYEH